MRSIASLLVKQIGLGGIDDSIVSSVLLLESVILIYGITRVALQ